MGKIFDNVKASLWNLVNAPGAEAIDDGPEDENWDNEDEFESRSRFDDDYDYERPTLRWGEREKGQASTTRQAQNNRVLEMHGKGRASVNVAPSVVIRHPADVAEAAKICDILRDDKICIIDLTGMERSMAQRIADFLGGACYALDGTVQRVSKDIFILAPVGINVSAELTEELEREGYVFPSRVR